MVVDPNDAALACYLYHETLINYVERHHRSASSDNVIEEACENVETKIASSILSGAFLPPTMGFLYARLRAYALRESRHLDGVRLRTIKNAGRADYFISEGTRRAASAIHEDDVELSFPDRWKDVESFVKHLAPAQRKALLSHANNLGHPTLAAEQCGMSFSNFRRNVDAGRARVLFRLGYPERLEHIRAKETERKRRHRLARALT